MLLAVMVAMVGVSCCQAVAPVVLGKTRAKQMSIKTGNYGDNEKDTVNKVVININIGIL